jgi:hypothetical protein
MIPRQQDYRIEKYIKIVCLKDNKNEEAIGLTPLEFLVIPHFSPRL